MSLVTILPTLLRLGGGIGLLLLSWFAYDRFEQKAQVKALTADRAACSLAAKSPADPLDRCAPEVTARVKAARKAEVCEAALAEGDLYVIRAACGEQVKRAVAERDAAKSSFDSAKIALAKAELETREAVSRAEARAITQADRKAQNDRTIDAAPRTGDGRVRCDAECVRRLAGEAGDGQARP